ncbi:hypothetical protein CYMTET_36148 [Cymbomonas tetramitiformis]|uniref:Uncharacterized protein n=1 Tax=Cymbomonas tetramitiformis TaxID=36881 RepID=A0AAE0CHS8_9CHLO|nr:hypothetical protein CYMTET_36148 [Cymbomonas tetramitiformis]
MDASDEATTRIVSGPGAEARDEQVEAGDGLPLVERAFHEVRMQDGDTEKTAEASQAKRTTGASASTSNTAVRKLGGAQASGRQQGAQTLGSLQASWRMRARRAGEAECFSRSGDKQGGTQGARAGEPSVGERRHWAEREEGVTVAHTASGAPGIGGGSTSAGGIVSGFGRTPLEPSCTPTPSLFAWGGVLDLKHAARGFCADELRHLRITQLEREAV